MYTFGDEDDIDSHTYDDLDNNNDINDIKHTHTHTIEGDSNNKIVDSK